MKTLCEWNPARDEIAWTIGEDRIGCHEPAALSLGRYGEWHLCVRCAGLSAFAHFRERSTLAALLYATGHAKLQTSKGAPTAEPDVAESAPRFADLRMSHGHYTDRVRATECGLLYPAGCSGR